MAIVNPEGTREYGIRTEPGGPGLDTTTDLKEAEGRLERLRDMIPDAVLVTRRLSPWQPIDGPPSPEMMPDWTPESEWTFEEWVFETRAVRDALAALGVQVPKCLPGEPEDCGESPWAHYASYLAILKANAQFMIETNLSHPAPGVAVHYGENVYEHALEEARQDWRDDEEEGR